MEYVRSQEKVYFYIDGVLKSSYSRSSENICGNENDLTVYASRPKSAGNPAANATIENLFFEENLTGQPLGALTFDFKTCAVVED